MPPAHGHRRLWRLAPPIIVANLTVPLQAAVDTAVMGHLGDPALLGGVALGGVIFTFLYWALAFLRMGTTGLSAQAEGALDRAALALILARGLLTAATIGIALIVLRRGVLWLALGVLEGTPAVQRTAATYFLIRIWSAPAALADFVVLGWLLGRQRVRRGLLVQAIINGANAVLAVVFVLGFGWGVSGVASATATADYLGLALGLLLVRPLARGTRPLLSLSALIDRAALGRLLAVNRDLFLRTLCLVSAYAYFTRAGARMGDVALAANAILLNFHTLMSYGLDGLANATEAIIGAAIGARDRTQFRTAVRTSLAWAFASAAGFALIFLVLGPTLIAVLTDIPSVRATAIRFLPWAIVSPLVSVWSFQLDGIFVGATATAALRNSMALALAVFLLAAQLLMPTLGNDGLWAAFMAFMATRAVALGSRLPGIGRRLGTSGK